MMGTHQEDIVITGMPVDRNIMGILCDYQNEYDRIEAEYQRLQHARNLRLMIIRGELPSNLMLVSYLQQQYSYPPDPAYPPTTIYRMNGVGEWVRYGSVVVRNKPLSFYSYRGFFNGRGQLVLVDSTNNWGVTMHMEPGLPYLHDTESDPSLHSGKEVWLHRHLRTCELLSRVDPGESAVFEHIHHPCF